MIWLGFGVIGFGVAEAPSYGINKVVSSVGIVKHVMKDCT